MGSWLTRGCLYYISDVDQPPSLCMKNAAVFLTLLYMYPESLYLRTLWRCTNTVIIIIVYYYHFNIYIKQLVIQANSHVVKILSLITFFSYITIKTNHPSQSATLTSHPAWTRNSRTSWQPLQTPLCSTVNPSSLDWFILSTLWHMCTTGNFSNSATVDCKMK